MTDIKQALLDPAAVFRTPQEVLEAQDLSRQQKIEVLRRWEYDVRELEVAEEENMPGPSGVELDEVLQALLALGVSIDTEHSPPTKEGGV
jgi:hypothetical protein